MTSGVSLSLFSDYSATKFISVSPFSVPSLQSSSKNVSIIKIIHPCRVIGWLKTCVPVLNVCLYNQIIKQWKNQLLKKLKTMKNIKWNQSLREKSNRMSGHDAMSFSFPDNWSIHLSYPRPPAFQLIILWHFVSNLGQAGFEFGQILVFCAAALVQHISPSKIIQWVEMRSLGISNIRLIVF
jgi:hypothetical protein